MYQGRRVAVLIVAAGKGSRMGEGPAKQYREIAGAPVLERTLKAFSTHPSVDDICIVVGKEGREFCNVLVPKAGNGKVRALVSGGESRQESVRNGLRSLEILREEGLLGDSAKAGPKGKKAEDDLVLIQDGARPFATKDLIDRVLEGTLQYGAAIPVVPVKDTIKYGSGNQVKETLPREKLFAAQTPQGFERCNLVAAMDKAKKKHFIGTDDASFVEKYGRRVCMVRGDYRNIKITTAEDLPLAEVIADDLDRLAEAMAPILLPGPLHEDLVGEAAPAPAPFVKPEPAPEPLAKPEPAPAKPARPAAAFVPQESPQPAPARPRAGTGFDVHVLVPDRPLILGGVRVPYEKGLQGHSDADVLTHAVMDALLGAAGMGDIGRHFPDTDPTFKGADSIMLLRYVAKLLQREGFRLSNLDVTLIAQAPKVAPYTAEMRANLARALQTDERNINVKATTTERLGYCGRGEGMAAQAVAVLFDEEVSLCEVPSAAAPVFPEKKEEPAPALDLQPAAGLLFEEPAEEPAEKPACYRRKKALEAAAAPAAEPAAPAEEPALTPAAPEEPEETGWIKLFTD